MAPLWLSAVVLCRDPSAKALISTALADQPVAAGHLRIGALCPFCQQYVLTVVHGERTALSVRQALADGDGCLHPHLPES